MEFEQNGYRERRIDIPCTEPSPKCLSVSSKNIIKNKIKNIYACVKKQLFTCVERILGRFIALVTFI